MIDKMILSDTSWFEGKSWSAIRSTVLEWLIRTSIDIIFSIIVLIIGNKLVKWLVKHINKSLQKSKMEPIVAKFLVSMIKFGLYFVVAIVVIGILGIPTASFVAALGTAGLTLGLALQGALSNFAGGVLILLFKPFRIGDEIVEDTHHNEGIVTGIDLFYTKILSYDNQTLIIPNGVLANSSLRNHSTQTKRRVDLRVGIAYDADLKVAREALLKVLDANEYVLQDDQKDVFVDALGDSEVTLFIRSWVNTKDYWVAKWDLLEKFKLALDENGVEIPYNHISVIMKDSGHKNNE